MDPQSAQHTDVWTLADEQHGVVTRSQLLWLGYGPDAIKHRVAKGRLHPVMRGVYAVGRPDLGHRGLWMAAILRCGVGATLSHRSAGTLWEVLDEHPDRIEVSVHAPRDPRPPGITVYRRTGLAAADITTRAGIPVTTPVCTFIDLAAVLPEQRLERAINEADKRDVVDPKTLRTALDDIAPRPGLSTLCQVLDRPTFVLTDSELERRFLPLARRAGLGAPLTGQWVNGFKVDFYWPELGLVVEVDGLRYHRTATQQARDRLRDQVHTAAGLTQIRFTAGQVRYEPRYVVATLRAVAKRLMNR